MGSINFVPPNREVGVCITACDECFDVAAASTGGNECNDTIAKGWISALGIV